MKNKLIDLNNHLFAQMERLSDESLAGDELKTEVERSRAVTGVAREIILNARLALDAAKAKSDGLLRGELPLMIGTEENGKP